MLFLLLWLFKFFSYGENSIIVSQKNVLLRGGRSAWNTDLSNSLPTCFKLQPSLGSWLNDFEPRNHQSHAYFAKSSRYFLARIPNFHLLQKRQVRGVHCLMAIPWLSWKALECLCLSFQLLIMGWGGHSHGRATPDKVCIDWELMRET